MNDITEFLNTEMNKYAHEYGLGVFFSVYFERDFESTGAKGRLKEGEIAVVATTLPSELSYFIEVKPYVLYALIGDGVDFKTAVAALKGFATSYNLKNFPETYEEEGTTYRRANKVQLEQPQIAQNFVYYGSEYGAIAIMGMSVTTIDKVVDAESAEISSEGIVSRGGKYGFTYVKYDSVQEAYAGYEIKPLTMSPVLTSAPNSEVFPGCDIAKSEISTSTLTFSITLPAVNGYLQDDIYAMFSATGAGRNRDFRFAFYLDNTLIDGNFKLINCKFDTSPDGAPVLALGFSL